MRIARRFGLLVSVLVLFATTFAGVILYQTSGQQLAIDRLRDLVTVAGRAGALGQELQKERAAAAWVVVSGGSGQRDGFVQQTRSTIDAADRYERLRRGLSAVPPGTAVLLDRIDTEIGGLPALREQVRSGKAVSLSAVTFAYRILIADLISYRDAVAQAGAPPDLADEIRAGAALSTAAESVALEQVVVLGTLAVGVQVTPAIQEDINATRTSYTEAITSFGSLAQPEWQSWLGHELVGPDIVAAQRLEDQVGRVQLGQRVQVNAVEWNSAMSARVARLHDVEARIDASVGAGIDRLHELRRRQTLGTAGGVLVVVLVAIVLAVAMGRPMVRRLRSLRDTAQRVATHDLAQAVANLRGGSVGPVDPAEYAARQTQVTVRGSDEIAEVGVAFNAVYREAIRTAVEQLILRRAAAENLVHLSRRGQMLLDLLTRLLDTVERDETDPERLDLLYSLDNAVTRTKRVNLSLLLLGGAGASVPQRDDVSVHDVLRAAISQIELYQRVDLGLDQTDAAVVGGAVDEVAHLFAELLDNATKYSGPTGAVYVDLAATPDGVIVQVFDQGTLSDPTRERLNSQLAAPGDTQFASMQSIGLVAVALIAARYGIQVHLRPNSDGGTVAVVELPRKILRQAGSRRREVSAYPTAVSPPAGSGVAARRTAVFETDRPVAADALTQELLPVSLVAAGQQPVEPLIFNQVAAAFSFTAAAEEGWRAANRAAVPVPARQTATGLPVRRPGDNLVPGSVATDARDQRPRLPRDPARVSASVAAHVRGLSARRPRQAVQLDIQVGQRNQS